MAEKETWSSNKNDELLGDLGNYFQDIPGVQDSTLPPNFIETEEYSEVDVKAVDLDLKTAVAGAKSVGELEKEKKQAGGLATKKGAEAQSKIDALVTENEKPKGQKLNEKNQEKLDIYDKEIDNIISRINNRGGTEEEIDKAIDEYEASNSKQIQSAREEREKVNTAVEELMTMHDSKFYSRFQNDEEKAEITPRIQKELENIVFADPKLKARLQSEEGSDTFTFGVSDAVDTKTKNEVINVAKGVVLNEEFDEIRSLLGNVGRAEFQQTQDQLEQDIALFNKLPEEEKTKEAYDLLVGRSEKLKADAQRIDDIRDQASERAKTVFSDLSYNVTTGLFDSNFKNLDKYNEWVNKHVKKDFINAPLAVGGDAVGTFVQESIRTIKDATIGFGLFGYNTLAMGGGFDKESDYSFKDAINIAYKNTDKYNWLGTSDFGADLVDKDGNFTINGRSASKSIAKTLPFMLGIMMSGGRTAPAALTRFKGPISGLANLQSLAHRAFGGGKSPAAMRNLSMMETTYRMTVLDNYYGGQGLGLSDPQASAYANTVSLATGFIQRIMPDKDFLGSTVGKNILNKFAGSLKTATTKQGLLKAAGNLNINIGKEIGEELIELGAGDLAKIAFGVSHAPEFTDIKVIKETIAATVLLSGSVGTVGAKKDFDSVKNDVYNQYKTNAKNIMNSINGDILVIQKKLQRKNLNAKTKEKLEQLLTQTYKTQEYGQSIVNAINLAPENVTNEQIDLLMQKNELIKLKKGKDKNLVGNIDEQIKVIDEKIKNSTIIQKQDELFDKTIKNVEGLAEEFNTDMEVLSSKEAVEKYGEKAGTQQGFFVDNKFVINKDVAKEQGAVNVAAHEFLHKVLETTFANEETSIAIGGALLGFMQENDKIKGTQFEKRLEQYTRDDKVLKSQEAQEVLTLFSDAIASGDIKFEENAFTKIGDAFRRIFQNLGFAKIKFNTGRDVYNFIKDYNKSIKKGKLTKAQQQVIKKGATIEKDSEIESFSQLDAVKQMAKEDRAKAKKGVGNVAYSKSTEQKINDIAPPTMTKEEYDRGGNTDAFMLLTSQDTTLNAVIRKGLEGNNVYDMPMADFIQAVKEQLQTAVTNFNPKVNDNLSGWIGFHISKKRPGIIDKAKKEYDLKQELKRRGAPDTNTKTDTDTGKQIKIYERFGKEGIAINKKIKQLMKGKDLTGKTFKNLKNVVLSDVQEMFGVKPKPGNLSKPDVKNAQFFINKNADLLFTLLPQGYNSKNKSTGVTSVLMTDRQTLEDVFYTKSEISKLKEGEVVTKAKRPVNLEIQKKIQNPGTDKVLEVFGITERDKPNLYKKDTNTSSKIRGIIAETERMMVNQAVREQLIEEGAPIQALSILEDGKAEPLFSKSLRDLSVEKQVVFFDRISETSSKLNPALVDVTSDKEIKKVLVDTYSDYISASELGKIAKDISRLLKQYTPALINNKTEPTKTWTEFLVEGLDQESNSIVKMLNIKIDGKRPSAASFYDNINSINKARRGVSEYGNHLLKQGKSLQEVARIMAILKPMYAGNSKIGRGKFKVDKDGFVIENNSFVKGTPRNQVFDNVSDFETYGIMQIEGMTPAIWKSANAKLKGQSSTAALKDMDFVGRFAEAQEARNIINTMMDFLVKSDAHDDVDIAMFMISNLSSMNAPLRRAANFQYVAEGALQVPVKQRGQKLEYEHMIPANYMAMKIIDVYKNQGGVKNSNEFYKNYTVAIIPKSMDGVIKMAGLQSNMTTDYDFDNDPSWVRYYNFLTNGAKNLVPIRDIKTNEIIGEEFTRIKAEKFKNDLVIEKAMLFSRSNRPTKGITVLDFDDTLATSKSLVKFTKPNGDVGTLTPEQYASSYQDMQDLGYKFDFSEFNKVVDGKTAPLFNKALKLQGKFGNNDMFVLTARPAESAPAIFAFLKANGLNIPLKNITGLANSTSEAKALWIANKVGEGYNDFYFADDALQNVQAVKNMLDQFDVKSKVQQAKVKFSKNLRGDINEIIEQNKGVGREKVFSTAAARTRGAGKGKSKLYIPPGAEDFMGLMYTIANARGKKGEAQIKFFEQGVLKPYQQGIRELNSARQAVANDYRDLLKKFPEVKKMLSKQIEGSSFSYDAAIRVYLWNNAGFEVPGISKRDNAMLVNLVAKDPGLTAFASSLSLISKRKEGYVEPSEDWTAESIVADLDNAVNKIGRSEYLQEFNENVEIVFSKENLNKIEAIYGTDYRDALENMLYRMKTGKNKSSGSSDAQVNRWTTWISNSVGAIMFLNMRSALLQTISAVNFVNWGDNNPVKAAMAFANQKQFWSDFSMIFNSDFLKQRRSGLKTDVNEAALANAVANKKNKAKAALAYMLKLGFAPTQIADSFAIAVGGASFYRNRLESYLYDYKDNLFDYKNEGDVFTDEEIKIAEKKAFADLQDVANVSQQSSDPSLISRQQASILGRFILAFQNTPMQYARIMKKAGIDLIKGRGDWKTNVSKIVYYGAIQNIIFASLQSAMFALLYDDDEDEKDQLKADQKKERLVNTVIDSLLRGTGIYGAILATAKNIALEFYKQDQKDYKADHAYTVLQFANISPPIGSKMRKLYSATQTRKFNKDVMSEMGITYKNPAVPAIAQGVEAFTNVPLGRAISKINNASQALNEENENWQRLALMMGWNTWDVGVENTEIKALRGEIKAKKKSNSKIKNKIKNKLKKWKN